MKNLTFLMIFVLLTTAFLLSSCAPEKTIKTKKQDQGEINPLIQIQDSITVSFFPFFNPELCNENLGIRPYMIDAVPSFLKVENKSSRILKVNIDKSSLSFSNQSCIPVSIDEIISRARRSGAEVIPAQVAFGFIGWSLISNDVTSSNRNLEESYHSKYFKPTLIKAGTTAKGIIFNQLPKKDNSISKSSFILNIMDLTSQKEINITIDIPDSLYRIGDLND